MYLKENKKKDVPVKGELEGGTGRQAGRRRSRSAGRERMGGSESRERLALNPLSPVDARRACPFVQERTGPLLEVREERA